MKKTIPKELVTIAARTGAHITAKTEPSKCSFCGKEEELRPYGPKNEWVCFDCGMKNEEAMKTAFRKTFNAPKNPDPAIN